MSVLDPTMSETEKLEAARNEFEACISHYYEHSVEAHRASRFYHNSGGEGQWEANDLEYLRKSGRPALTFNLVKPSVDTFVGMHDEAKRKAIARPAGGEDRFLADVLCAIVDCLDSRIGQEQIDEEVRLNGAVQGAYNCVYSVTRDPDDPSMMMVRADAINGHEILWDLTSETPDRNDAGYLFWSRWLTKSEFTREYPEHADEWDELVRRSDPDLGQSFNGSESASAGDGMDFFGFGGNQSDSRYDRYYWDRRRNKIRIVHMQYKAAAKRHYIAGPTGVIRIPAEIRGHLEQRGVRVFSTWGEDLHWLEFIGTKVLYDKENPEPFEGFSAVPFSFHLDVEENVPYGMVRNLFDPQCEFNKSYSQSTDLISAQAKPGTIAEEDAIPDIDAFEEERSTPGGTAIVSKNALVEGRVQQQKVPEFSPAAQMRLENSGKIIEKVTGISSDTDTPAAHAEAAATVQIRFRKSYLKMRPAITNFERYQRQAYEKRVQIVCNAMPDEQIEAILGNHNKFRVRQGIVAEIDPETGQVLRTASLEDMRKLRYDIEFEMTAENATMRLMELQSLGELVRAGVDVPPELMLRKALSSRADRDTAEQHAKQMARAKSEAAEREAQVMSEQVGATLQIEAGKAQETARHNQAEEALKAEKMTQDYNAKMAAVLERADKAEMDALLELFGAVEQRQMQRDSIAVDALRIGGV